MNWLTTIWTSFITLALALSAFAGGLDEELNKYLQYEADMCLQAKQRLMEAETDEAFEVAMRRVNFLCDN